MCAYGQGQRTILKLYLHLLEHPFQATYTVFNFGHNDWHHFQYLKSYYFSSIPNILIKSRMRKKESVSIGGMSYSTNNIIKLIKVTCLPLIKSPAFLLSHFWHFFPQFFANVQAGCQWSFKEISFLVRIYTNHHHFTAYLNNQFKGPRNNKTKPHNGNYSRKKMRKIFTLLKLLHASNYVTSSKDERTNSG